MFSLELTDEFRRRAHAAILFPRGLIASAAPNLRAPYAGAYFSLGAIALGGALMFANIAHERSIVSVAPPPPLAGPTTPIQAVALDPPKPTSPPPVAEKATMRIDASPVGAVSDPARVKPKHKRHSKKVMEADNPP